MDNNKLELPDCGMYIGTPVYMDRGDYIFQTSGLYYTTWVPEDREPEWYIKKVKEDNQGNLAIIWDGGATKRCLKAMAKWLDLESTEEKIPNPDWEENKFLIPEDWDVISKNMDRYGAGLLKLVKSIEKEGLYSYSIYCNANPEWAAKISSQKTFLGYNIGEAFSFDIESDNEAEFRENALEISKDYNLKMIAENFAHNIKTYFREKKKEGWNRFFTTSAGFHADAEIAYSESSIIPHIECFAFNNINFGMSLCRGIYKQFDLPAWGTYLAHEHYSFLPYSSEYKFKSLDAALNLAYINGSKITVSESGNWWLQSDHVSDSPTHDTPKIDLGPIQTNKPHKYSHLVPEARKHYDKLNYNSEICKKYRKSISKFYDYVKENGTPEGQPEVNFAALKGRYDFSAQSFHPNAAIASAYKIAENNPLWYEGMPERGWEIFRKVFFPLNDTFGKYNNRYISGTPYGQCDIVSLAGNINANFLTKNYKAVMMTGWNSAIDGDYEMLKKYVYNGGILFLSIPHLSKNITRNYVNYSPDELINAGDFSELCGVKVLGRGTQLYWVLMTEGNCMGLPKHKRFGTFYTHMGDIEITGSPETIAVHDESYKPFLLRNSYGKGQVYFLNSWQYPGALDHDIAPGANKNSKGLVGEIFKHIAKQVRQTVYITDDGINEGVNCEYVVYSYFPSNGKTYLQNIDFDNSRKIFLHKDGKHQKLNLSPAEFKII